MLLLTLIFAVGIQTPDMTCRARDKSGELVRSQSRREEFLLETTGSRKTPPGFCVDHVVPLVCGGCDVPSNMALMKCTEMRVKDDAMRVRSRSPRCNWPMKPYLPGEFTEVK